MTGISVAIANKAEYPQFLYFTGSRIIRLTDIAKADWLQSGRSAIVLAALATVPLWPMAEPVLVDLPAHVSRYHTQQEIHTSSYLSHYFVYDWQLIPNLGVDILVAALGPLLGTERAAHMIVALLPGIFVLGMLLVAKEVHKKLPWTSLFALPLAYSYPFIFGFVNYWLSIGLAFIGLFICLRFSRLERPLARSAALAAYAPFVLVSHMAGFGVFGIFCFGGVLGNALEKGESLLHSIIRAIVACMPITWPLVVLILSGKPSAGFTGIWFDIDGILLWTVGMLRTRWMAIDILSALIVLCGASLPLLLRRSFKWSLSLLIPGILLAIFGVLLPRLINGSDYGSLRLIPVAVALVLLAVHPKRPSLPLAWAGYTFFVVRSAILFFAIQTASSRAHLELTGLTHVRPGSRIAAFHITGCDRQWEPRYLNHIQSMAITRRDAMVNDNFAQASGQIMNLTPTEINREMPGQDVRNPGCLRGDVATFDNAYAKLNLDQVDYLWIIDTVGIHLPQDRRLKRIWSKEGSVIFEVGHPQSLKTNVSAH
ncbi:hypothetical protein [Sphingobium subterraneum]|nr:hypothetical protein [Sphingobium subterraneum]